MNADCGMDVSKILTIIKESGMMESVSGALQEEMQKKSKEKIVTARYKIKSRPRTRKGKPIIEFYTYHNSEPVTSVSYDTLIDKLYELAMDRVLQDTTVEQLFEMFHESRCEDTSISSRTSSYDRVNWNRFFKDTDFAKMKVRDVTTSLVLKEYKRIAGRGKMTKKVFNKAASLLNLMFDYAIEQEIIQTNIARNTPTKKLVFKPAADNSDMVYKPEQRDKLLEHVRQLPQTRYTLAVRLMACFPLRIGELRALTWEDYDEEEKKLWIRHEIVKESKDGKNKCDMDVPFTKGAKNSGIRKIKVSSEAAKVLEELRAINGDKKYILHGQGAAQFAILENRTREHLMEYCEAAGVQYFSPHKFRFYGATEMYRAGVPLNTIRYYLGHSTIQMTEHYLRLVPDDVDDEVIEKIFS